MILDGITGGISILLLIPLLSLTGIVGDSKSELIENMSLPFLDASDKSAVLVAVLFLYIVLIVFQAVITRKLSILNAEIVQGYVKHLRVALFDGIINAKWSYLSGKRKSDITNAFTNEITKISSGTVFFLRTAAQLLLAVVQIAIAFMMSPPLTVFVIIAGCVIFFVMRKTLAESKKLGSSLREINQDLMSSITEHLGSIKEVKSYGIEKTQKRYFNETADKTYKNITAFTRLQSKTTLLYEIFAALGISAMFYIAVVFLNIEPMKLLIIVYIFARLWPLFSSLQSNLQNINIMLPSYNQLCKLMSELEENSERLRKTGENNEVLLQNSVCFKDVSFAYDTNDSFELKNVNIEIKAKKMLAIVGKSGSGKSTLVDILLGLLKPQSGEISVDGMTVCEETMSKWRSSIGYVPQTPFLYNTTIRENMLRFTPSATEEDIIKSLMLADAYEFVEKLPSGIDTTIGDNGIRLSGGQRQRIVLARALLRNPRLLVLDEATSSLDNESEHRIQKAVEALSGKITVVVIAHRMSTIINADSIIVIDDGTVVESGNYCELSKKKDGYFYGMINLKEELTE